MIVEHIAVGPLVTNCYIIGCETTGRAAVIDPGADPDGILGRIRSRGLKPVWILDTHGHGDHIGAQGAVKEAYPDATIAIHESEGNCLTDPSANLSAMLMMPVTSPPADRLLRDNDEINVGELILRVIHVPGHSPGGVAFYCGGEEAPSVFSGDALFAGSIGRGDLPGGDLDLLLGSIRSRLFALPGATRVYPGHGAPTTIEKERKTNPFLTHCPDRTGEPPGRLEMI